MLLREAQSIAPSTVGNSVPSSQPAPAKMRTKIARLSPYVCLTGVREPKLSRAGCSKIKGVNYVNLVCILVRIRGSICAHSSGYRLVRQSSNHRGGIQ